MNDVPAEMSSLVLYYAIDEPTLIETDRIEIGSGRVRGRARARRGRARRPRRCVRRSAATTATSRSKRRESRRRARSFRVAVDPGNRGVRLRRLADIGLGRQSATVLVDGQAAGTWYTADVNPLLRWADLDFDVPARLTRGRDAIDVDPRRDAVADTVDGLRLHGPELRRAARMTTSRTAHQSPPSAGFDPVTPRSRAVSAIGVSCTPTDRRS